MSEPAAIFTAEALAGGGTGPLYLRLKSLIRGAIDKGALTAQDALPSEREIASQLDISRVTVRKALTELVDEGVLTQKRGSGTYVTGQGQRVEQRLSRLTSFTEDMLARGLMPSVKWLQKTVASPSPDEAMVLALSPNERVIRLRRLRMADGRPMALELAVVPARMLASPDAVGSSLYEALQTAGIRPVRAMQRLSAESLSAEDAEALSVPAGSPALYIERISYLADGRAVEFTKSHYRGDAYDFVVELTTSGETE
ncbi:GntR family transcriptional regulator [Dongia rigui]|uniref:GntR family transcriptional regulator n=1 Tax=Dongia rigui TaxID=940149 RepID=A0ABU5DZB9_9PROT|nr:GntR family transcriptional regulator [Dongia rigui]MDY0872682.1 GntR family transcriptional regulator [Dongia rigui]